MTPSPLPSSLHPLIERVRDNCRLASAGQAGLYSLCGVLLRLRQLYKWSHQLAPWQEPEPGQVLAWVESEESLWDSLEGLSFQPLPLGGTELDPFQVAEVNQALFPQDLAYGAGYTRNLAPTFFLGRLTDVRHVEELTILVLGPELARDLDGTPALLQGNLIYARKEALAFYLWDRLSDPVQENNAPLRVALEAYGLSRPALLQDPEAHGAQLARLLEGELEAVIHHEIGEAREPSLKMAFPLIMELFPQTRAELWVRALKDALADVNEFGRLKFIVEAQRVASLGLVLAWRPGLYHLLLPELEGAFQQFVDSGDWEGVDRARRGALTRLRATARSLSDLMDTLDSAQPTRTLRELESQYLTPLGI